MKVLLAIVLTIIIAVLAVAAAGVFQLRKEGPQLAREADRFNIPVIEQATNKLSSWNYDDLKPYLGKKFIELLATDKELQQDLDTISVLGKVVSFRNPRHVSHKKYDHWLYGNCAVNRYSVSVRFEKGKGVVKYKLNHCYKNPKITFLQVVSKELPSNSPAFQ